VAARTLALVFFFTALMQVLELLDVTTDVLDRGLGATGLAYYAALRLPSEVLLALPLAALLGAMWAFSELARSHEMIPIRASGVSPRRMIAWLLPVPFAVALAQVVLAQAIVPVSEATLKSWWDASAPADETPERSWVRTSSGPVSFLAAAPDGRRLTAVRIYVRGEDDLLTERISARTAQWTGEAWRLDGVEALAVDGVEAIAAAGARVQRAAGGERLWRTNLRPEDVRRVDVARPNLSSIMLADVIVGERVGTEPLSYYETALWRSFVAPLAAFIMLLLALPTARGLPRRDDGGRSLLIALGLGLAFLLCDGIMAALGTSDRVPAALAALAAPALFAAIGLLQLRISERR